MTCAASANSLAGSSSSRAFWAGVVESIHAPQVAGPPSIAATISSPHCSTRRLGGMPAGWSATTSSMYSVALRIPHGKGRSPGKPTKSRCDRQPRRHAPTGDPTSRPLHTSPAEVVCVRFTLEQKGDRQEKRDRAAPRRVRFLAAGDRKGSLPGRPPESPMARRLQPDRVHPYWPSHVGQDRRTGRLTHRAPRRRRPRVSRRNCSALECRAASYQAGCRSRIAGCGRRRRMPPVGDLPVLAARPLAWA